VVAGKSIDPRADQIIRLPGVGTLTVGESVDSLRMPGGHRGFEIALHLRLRKAYGAYPAGTEVLVGYAEAAAAAPPPAPPRTTAAVAGPALASGDALGHDTARAEQPPPGGFTRTPPITVAARAQLLSNEYVFPVVGGARFSDDFGGPRADTGFHQGIDLFAPDGTPVVAVHDGTLFLVGWNRLGGRRIWLDDGHGDLFYYAHLSGFAPLARDGATVRAGDVIGFVGDSGDAQGTPFHLHFEIHPGGGWAVPPIEYVTAWLKATPGLDPSLAPVAPPPAPVTQPQAVSEAGSTDLGSASGLDDQSLATASGGSVEAGVPQPAPDAVAEVSGADAPAFAGSP
jgi:murein DD-endopeptidase MepM/ murein hydrolase activator NlpD